MKLITISLTTFILFLATLVTFVTYLYITGARAIVVTSLGELIYDLVGLYAAMVIAIVALGRYLKEVSK